LLVAPGFWQTQITQNLIDTAEERQDVLAIIDIENDYTTEYESTDDETTRTGTAQDAKNALETRVLDSTYACAFYPAVQIMDVLNNNRMLWAPASLAGLGGIAQSEAASAAWFAPAGFNRGGLGALGGSSGPVVTRARQRLDSDDRDLLYDEANVNPIATFPNEGVVIFGQKTLQAASNSALSRINVRRLLIYLKTRINTVAQNILFDQNLPSTWARFVGQADPILADVKARFGLTDYKLVLDETTTTPELIDQNVLYAQVYLKPARAIEYIAIDFIVTRTGASFV
jgi:phage tail sheath protein FI